MGIFDAINPFKPTTEKPTLTRSRMVGPQDDFDDSSVGHPVIYSGVSAKALNLKTASTETALHEALKDPNHTGDIIGLIQQMSPEELGAQDKEGNTALHLAIMQNKRDIAIALATRMLPEDVHVKNSNHQTQAELYFAAYQQNRDKTLTQIIQIMEAKSKLTNKEFELLKNQFPEIANPRYKPAANQEAPKTTNS